MNLKIRKILGVTMALTISMVTMSFADTTNSKVITLDTATKIALEKNLDLKNYDIQKEKVQSNIDTYFNNIANQGIYQPGMESMLAQLELSGAQTIQARDSLDRGIILKREMIKSTVESSFATITKTEKELKALEEKYVRELGKYNTSVKKESLGTISKTLLEQERLALIEVSVSINNKKTDLEIAKGALNKLLKLSNFEEYTIEEYKVEYEVLDWEETKIESHIKQVPNFDINVLNKRGEAEYNRNEFNNIVTLNDGKQSYVSLKSDVYIAEVSASQLAEESINAARDKYNNMQQLQASITAMEQNLKSLEYQYSIIELRYKLGQVSKSDMNNLESSIIDLKNQVESQQDSYMSIRRTFENKVLAGL